MVVGLWWVAIMGRGTKRVKTTDQYPSSAIRQQ